MLSHYVSCHVFSHLLSTRLLHVVIIASLYSFLLCQFFLFFHLRYASAHHCWLFIEGFLIHNFQSATLQFYVLYAASTILHDFMENICSFSYNVRICDTTLFSRMTFFIIIYYVSGSLYLKHNWHVFFIITAVYQFWTTNTDFVHHINPSTAVGYDTIYIVKLYIFLFLFNFFIFFMFYYIFLYIYFYIIIFLLLFLSLFWLFIHPFTHLYMGNWQYHCY